jgi:SAM-dependent methyltransferase
MPPGGTRSPPGASYRGRALPVDLFAFVSAHLPPRARLLEVGCGRGELARRLARGGHDVTAIDPAAPAGDIFRKISLEELPDSEGPFDAVVASRSLHHIPDLLGALDKIVRLLRPAGVVIVNEHAWDLLDGPTARWYVDRRWKAADARRSVDDCLLEWERDHAGLHGFATMRDQFDRHFTERFFAWVPYLYGELGDPKAEAEEAAMIEAGEIRATGFRYVGERSYGRD